MKKTDWFMHNMLVAATVSLLVCTASPATARFISTFDAGGGGSEANGADSEVREDVPTSNRGTNAELAARADSSRISKMYVKLPVGSITPAELAGPITYRVSIGAINLTAARVSNTTAANPPTHPVHYTGLDYYVLDPTHAGADWVETTITYNNAPGGLVADANFQTKDLDLSAGNLTFLGRQQFRSIAYVGTQPQENHLPVGDALDITLAPGSALHNAIVAAQATAHKSVTLVSTMIHNYNGLNQGVLPDDPSQTPHGNFNGINYVFNAKERNPLLADTTYDNDVAAMDGNEGSPWSAAANTQQTPFAPQLILVPEPSSMLLVLLGGMAIAAWQRRGR